MLSALFGVKTPRELAGLVPGTLVCVLIMLVALWFADWLGSFMVRPGSSSPVSAVLVAILLGAALRNLFALPEALAPGIGFAVKKLLRLGIILIGIKLSLLEILKLGAWGIPVVLAAIATGLFIISWLNQKLGLPPRLGTLIAAGTSICGVTAVVSTAPAIEADEKEVAYAVANVTAFGLVGMLVYPYLAPLILTTSEQIGLFLGTAIHDTAQVMAAALTSKEVFGDEVAFKTATVTKMTRNLFLAVVVPFLAWRYNQETEAEHTVDVKKLLPAFVLGFLALSLVRTLGDAGLAGDPQWKALVHFVGDLVGAKYLLGTAMAGVGLGTHASVFRGVGLRPFAVGLLGALVVGFVGFLGAATLGSYLHLPR